MVNEFVKRSPGTTGGIALDQFAFPVLSSWLPHIVIWAVPLSVILREAKSRERSESGKNPRTTMCFPNIVILNPRIIWQCDKAQISSYFINRSYKGWRIFESQCISPSLSFPRRGLWWDEELATVAISNSDTLVGAITITLVDYRQSAPTGTL